VGGSVYGSRGGDWSSNINAAETPEFIPGEEAAPPFSRYDRQLPLALFVLRTTTRAPTRQIWRVWSPRWSNGPTHNRLPGLLAGVAEANPDNKRLPAWLARVRQAHAPTVESQAL